MVEEFPSVRGLIDTDIGPLRKFTGILDSAPREPKTSKTGKAYSTVTLNFKDIEVIEAIEPYHYPIFSIELMESNRKGSKWGVFGESLVAILDQQYSADELDPGSPNFVHPKDRMNLSDCFGKRFGMVMADGEDGRPKSPDLWDGRTNEGKGGNVPTPSWKVYSVEGIGSADSSGATPEEEAMQLLDGKTLAEFNQAALQNEAIRSDVALLQAIGSPPASPKNFANALVKAGKFSKDAQGVYHKVEE